MDDSLWHPSRLYCLELIQALACRRFTLCKYKDGAETPAPTKQEDILSSLQGSEVFTEDKGFLSAADRTRGQMEAVLRCTTS